MPPNYTSPPPYQEYVSNEQQQGPFIPEDFKYSTKVVSCEAPVRERFAFRVYSLLSTQLVITFAWSYCVYLSDQVRDFVMTHMGVMIFFMITSVVTCFWIALSPRQEDYEAVASENALMSGDSEENRPAVPWYILSKNSQRILLWIFTFSEAYSISLVTVVYDPKTILSALIITTVVVVGIMLITVSGKFRTSIGSIKSIYYWLNWALLLLVGMGISSLFFGMSSAMDLAYGWLGAIVFTIYLFIDTQLIFRKVYPDEEIRCAMMLYLDIINLFLSILRILNHQSDD